eukprot:15449557-Alexandrium_andersonii.AAC.1
MMTSCLDARLPACNTRSVLASPCVQHPLSTHGNVEYCPHDHKFGEWLWEGLKVEAHRGAATTKAETHKK